MGKGKGGKKNSAAISKKAKAKIQRRRERDQLISTAAPATFSTKRRWRP